MSEYKFDLKAEVYIEAENRETAEAEFDLLIDTLQKYGLEVTDTSIVNPPELEEAIKKGVE